MENIPHAKFVMTRGMVYGIVLPTLVAFDGFWVDFVDFLVDVFDDIARN